LLSVTAASRAARFQRDGFVAVEGLLQPAQVDWYRAVYDRFLSGAIDVGRGRSDLGVGAPSQRSGVENITQVMWPSDSLPALLASPADERAPAVAREILGDDLAFDFDMLIDKAPGTATPTPWHQDCAYRIDLPDRRAASCWIALDDATVELERARGFDHGKDAPGRENRNPLTR
jgi:ectoine hydroxylase-related dioxygenase (phytanoyl-CoA dioxygenase family)